MIYGSLCFRTASSKLAPGCYLFPSTYSFAENVVSSFYFVVVSVLPGDSLRKRSKPHIMELLIVLIKLTMTTVLVEPFKSSIVFIKGT